MRNHADPDFLRTIILRPYRPGAGPYYRLTLWDANRADHLGKSIVRYELKQFSPADRRIAPIVLFAGEDFACSPMHAIDSDDCAAGLLAFLTLRPGDTDREYFDTYTAAQLDFAESHADAVSAYVFGRFGER